MKKLTFFFIILILIIILSIFSILVFASSTFGDVNGDNLITSTDISIIERHVLSVISLTDEKFTYADVNRDSKITSSDISIVERYLLGVITTFPTSSSTNSTSTPIVKSSSSPTIIPTSSNTKLYTYDGYDRLNTFNRLFQISGEKYFYENGDGKIIDGIHYGTGTRTGSSQFGGHFFGDFVLPEEIKNNVVAMNKFDLFSDSTYKNPLMAGAVLEIKHEFLNQNGEKIAAQGTTQDTAYVIVTDSMFDEGRVTGDIDIFTETYDKMKGNTEGGGCIFVSWKVVEFSNLSTNLKPSYIWQEANNPYFLSFKLLWHKLPVKSIYFKGENLPRTQDNFFKLPNQSVTSKGTIDVIVNYIDGSAETVTLGGPQDKSEHNILKIVDNK